jgi:hypothetical protein
MVESSLTNRQTSDSMSGGGQLPELPRVADVTAALSDDDRAALDDLDQKAAVVRDRVRSVALRLRSSLYLWGPGGEGKSWIVRSALEQFTVESALYNSRMTGRALCDVLEARPDALHVIEDMERLLDDRDAQGILRAATGGEDGEERIVTWSTVAGIRRFVFRGGLVIVSNRPLVDRPVLNAIATRLNPLEWSPTDRELEALMRRIALRGYVHVHGRLTPNECQEVADHLLDCVRQEARRLDLRLLFHAFLDRIQWAHGETSLHWQELVASMVVQQPRNGEESATRAGRKRVEQELITEICQGTDDRHEQIEKWTEETGKSEKAFYRRLREMAS